MSNAGKSCGLWAVDGARLRAEVEVCLIFIKADLAIPLMNEERVSWFVRRAIAIFHLLCEPPGDMLVS